MEEEEELGRRLLEELEGRQEMGVQKVGSDGPERLPRELGMLDWIEEYAMLAVLLLIVSYFVVKKVREWREGAAFSASSRNAEESMRRARQLQQAKFELETAQRREELALFEEERRQQKLEEAEAMLEGRSSKKPEKKKACDAIKLSRRRLHPWLNQHYASIIFMLQLITDTFPCFFSSLSRSL